MVDDTTSDRNLRWLTLVLCGVVLVIGWSLWPALVLAAWTAHLGRPLLQRLAHLMHGRKRAAATSSLLLFLILAIPSLLLILGVISGAQHLATTLAEAPSARSALAALTSGGPGVTGVTVPRTVNELMVLVQRFGAEGFELGSRIADLATSGVIVLFIYFAGVYTLLLHGEETWGWLRRHLPLAPAHLTRLGRAFHETGRGLLLGVGLSTLTQAVVATVVYMVLDVPRAWILGPLTGVASIIPVVGSALVWAPLVLGLFIAGDVTRAVILAALGVVVISSVDNVLRPLFSRIGALQLPMLLIFVSLLGGVFTFGVNGAILGPLFVRLAKEAMQLLHERNRPHGHADGEGPALADSSPTTPPAT